MFGKRTVYNIFFGMVGQLFTIGIGIMIPRLFLLNYGSDANGLIASIGQILAYATLFEAGIGVVSLQALYAPVANNRYDDINAILTATNMYFKRICKYYLLAAIIFAIAYPYFIESSLSYTTVLILAFLMGIPGMLSYYFQATYKIFLQVEGKNYVVANINTITMVLIALAKVIMLMIGCSLIVFQSVCFIVSILQILLIVLYVKRNYSWLNMYVVPNYNAMKQKNSAFVHQLANLVLLNTDIILLTAFCGLKVVSVYVIYNMVFDAATNLIQIVNTGFMFVIGQNYSVYDKNRFEILFDIYETYFMAFSFAVVTGAYLFIIPFLRIYTSGIQDISYIDENLAILFFILKLVATTRTPCLNIINVSGHYRETQNQAITEATLNLIVSIICVYVFGIYGALIGTITALLYRSMANNLYANRIILERSAKKTLIRIIVNCLSVIIILMTISPIQLNVFSYQGLIIEMSRYSLVICGVFFVINIVVFKKVFYSTICCMTKNK